MHRREAPLRGTRPAGQLPSVASWVIVLALTDMDGCNDRRRPASCVPSWRCSNFLPCCQPLTLDTGQVALLIAFVCHQECHRKSHYVQVRRRTRRL